MARKMGRPKSAVFVMRDKPPTQTRWRAVAEKSGRTLHTSGKKSMVVNWAKRQGRKIKK